MDVRFSRYGRALTPPHRFAEYIMREEEVTAQLELVTYDSTIPQASPAREEEVTYDTLMCSTIPQTSPAQLELWSQLITLAQDR